LLIQRRRWVLFSSSADFGRNGFLRGLVQNGMLNAVAADSGTMVLFR
jgi:hypothetical protein